MVRKYKKYTCDPQQNPYIKVKPNVIYNHLDLSFVRDVIFADVSAFVENLETRS